MSKLWNEFVTKVGDVSRALKVAIGGKKQIISDIGPSIKDDASIHTALQILNAIIECVANGDNLLNRRMSDTLSVFSKMKGVTERDEAVFALGYVAAAGETAISNIIIAKMMKREEFKDIAEAMSYMVHYDTVNSDLFRSVAHMLAKASEKKPGTVEFRVCAEDILRSKNLH